MQDELNNCKNVNTKLTKYIRELEQTNDDLERSNFKKSFLVLNCQALILFKVNERC